MVDESLNEPHDPTEVRFLQLEQQVIDINHNVNLLIEALRNNLAIFREDGSLNVEDILEEESRDREDTENQLKKEPKKYQPNSTVMNQSLLKMEEIFYIKSYHGKITALKLNNYLQEVEVYFSFH